MKNASHIEPISEYFFSYQNICCGYSLAIRGGSRISGKGVHIYIKVCVLGVGGGVTLLMEPEQTTTKV